MKSPRETAARDRPNRATPKVRAACLAETSEELGRRFGPAGAELAAADAGPRDQTSRGSAMNNAATTNWDEGERDASAMDAIALQSQGKVPPMQRS